VARTPFEIDTDSSADTARLALSGELDLATVPRVERAVDATLARGDLSGLSFVDSSGLRLFVALQQRAVTEGWELSLVRPQEQAMRVFRISGLEENLPFAEKSSMA
jgi:anti-sigma B factor antagonist